MSTNVKDPEDNITLRSGKSVQKSKKKEHSVLIGSPEPKRKRKNESVGNDQKIQKRKEKKVTAGENKSFKKESDSKLIQVTQVRCINSGAGAIIHTDLKETWAYKDKKITIYNENFEVMDTITLDWEMSDMTKSYSTEYIIATDFDNCRISKITRAGDVTPLRNTWLRADGVCINDKQEVVVGLCAGYGPPDVRVMIYSPDTSTTIRKIEMGKHGKHLFNGRIFQVKQNGNGDYIIANVDRIVCVNREGKFRWQYRVNDDVYGLVCDKYSNVIIAEFYNKKITLLDKDGVFVQTLLTAEDGIEMPSSLSIDWFGNLWVGQCDDIKIFKYIN